MPITFFNSTAFPQQELQKSSCLILTSRFEGTPNVVLEAMASHVFVIAPSIVDLPIILGNNERGFIYEEGSATDLLLKINDFLALNEDDRELIVSDAFEFANQNFNTKSFVKSYLRLLDEK